MATLTPGQSLTTPGRTIGAGDINLFAGLVGDFTPIHVDETFAKSSPYGTRIAHGPLAMATAIGMLTQTGILGEKVGAGNGKTHGAFELAFGGLGVVAVQADAGVDGEAVDMLELVNAGEDVFLDGLGQGHIMRRENQFHTVNLLRK